MQPFDLNGDWSGDVGPIPIPAHAYLTSLNGPSLT
jgi:hypothetical protein